MALAYLSAADVARRVTSWEPLVAAAKRALIAQADGNGEAPMRTSIPLPSGQLLSMPGLIRGGNVAIVKLVSVVPQNAARGLPIIHGVAALFDVNTGQPTALVDGGALTVVRTAAISAAAARRLVAAEPRTLALLGAGVQARWHAPAFAATFPIERILIWSRTPGSRDRLAATLEDELAIHVEAANSVDDAVRDADLICCATTANEPFLHAQTLPVKPVAIVAIGAFRPDMSEVAPDVLRRAGRVYVDGVEESLHEAGDVIGALDAGALTRDDVIPIGRMLADERPPTSTGVAVFKSVGSAVQDAAVAQALLT